MGMAGNTACRVDSGAPQRPLESFAGQRVHAVAGIGNPPRFFRDLRERGIEVLEHPFADHHPFTAQDVEFGDPLPVLMTEKDAVKCREFTNRRLWYVPIEARFAETQERELLQCVLRKTALAAIARG
jgi:tetraacyldisaccharide 4'-kinase